MPDGTHLIARVLQRGADLGVADDLPTLAGISALRLDEIRSGAPVSATEYEQLCRAVAVDPVVMYRGEDRKPQRLPARFRAATSSDRPNAADVRLLALAAEQGRVLAGLLALLRRSVKLDGFRKVLAVPSAKETWKEGYALGERARAALSPGAGPLRELEQLLRDLGVHVARVAFSSPDVDAASVWEPRAVPVVLLNTKAHAAKHPGPRRATLAHELCHLLHDAGAHNITTRVSWGCEGTGNYDETVEVRARAFAPAFLAPRSEITGWAASQKASVRSHDTALVKALAEAWGLSFEGAAWHAKNCKLLPATRADELAHRPRKPRVSYAPFETVQAGALPGMVNDALPEHATPLWDGWATEIVLLAMEEGAITVGRARELLSWS